MKRFMAMVLSMTLVGSVIAAQAQDTTTTATTKNVHKRPAPKKSAKPMRRRVAEVVTAATRASIDFESAAGRIERADKPHHQQRNHGLSGHGRHQRRLGEHAGVRRDWRHPAKRRRQLVQ